MPILCCVYSCKNVQKKDSEVSFYSIPSVIKNQGQEIQKLSKERRNQWFSAIHRLDDSWKKTEYWRVCGIHFFSGKPSNLLDKNNPDWVPSLNLGYSRSGAATGVECVNDRFKRYMTRKKKAVE